MDKPRGLAHAQRHACEHDHAPQHVGEIMPAEKGHTDQHHDIGCGHHKTDRPQPAEAIDESQRHDGVKGGELHHTFQLPKREAEIVVGDQMFHVGKVVADAVQAKFMIGAQNREEHCGQISDHGAQENDPDKFAHAPGAIHQSHQHAEIERLPGEAVVEMAQQPRNFRMRHHQVVTCQPVETDHLVQRLKRGIDQWSRRSHAEIGKNLEYPGHYQPQTQ